MAVTFNASTSSGLVTTADNSGQIAFQTNGTQFNPLLTAGTAQASTSGSNIDFSGANGVPSWAKRITIMFNGVSTNGTADINIQLGTGSTPTYTTSGYLGSVSTQNGTAANFSSGFTVINGMAATSVFHGNIIICNVTGNTWSEIGLLGKSDVAGVRTSGGSIPLAAALTAIRITTTDTFDLGSINILYE